MGATHSFDESPSPDIVLVPGGMSTFEHARDETLLGFRLVPSVLLLQWDQALAAVRARGRRTKV